MIYKKHLKILVKIFIPIIIILLVCIYRSPKQLVSNGEKIIDIAFWHISPEIVELHEVNFNYEKQNIIEILSNSKMQHATLSYADKDGTVRLLIAIANRENKVTKNITMYINKEHCWIENYRNANWEIINISNLGDILFQK